MGVKPARRRLPLGDAYLPWAQATQFRDAGGEPSPTRWLWLLLEVRGTARAFFTLTLPVQRRWIRVPASYANPPKGLADVHFCTAIVSADMLAVLTTGDASATGLAPAPAAEAGAVHAVRDAIARFEVGFTTAPWPAQPAAAAVPKRTAVARPGPRVVVGVIDDGLAFANARFCVPPAAGRPGRATRFLSLWDQGSATPPRGGAGSGCAYGRQQGAAALNRHIAQSVDAASGCVDEDAVYQRAGYRELRQRATHGTHVLDLAAGAAPADAAGAPHIVGVQVPGRLLQDTSCASTTVFLLDALHHVLAEADRAFPAAPAGPALVNISMGNIAGPHDGSSLFERALDEVIQRRRRLDAGFHVVMPAGNSLLSRCHAQLLLPPGGRRTLTWRVQPDDGTPNFLELWLRPADAERLRRAPAARLAGVTLTLTSPRGEACSAGAGAGVGMGMGMGIGETQFIRDRGGAVVAMASLQPRVANGRAAMALLAIAPTQAREAADEATTTAAAAGAWTLTLAHAGDAPLDVQASVQRDDLAFGRRSRARQSFLEDTGYREFTAEGRLQLHDDDAACVRRVGTFNGLATGNEVSVAGGAVNCAPAATPLVSARYAAVERPALASETDRRRRYPMAVTEDSPVLPGVLAAGTRSGSVVALRGTSMAAPQRLRALWEATHADGQALDAAGLLRPLVGAAPEVALRAARRRGDAPPPALAPASALPTSAPAGSGSATGSRPARARGRRPSGPSSGG